MSGEDKLRTNWLDDEIFEQAASILQKRYEQKNGSPLRFGSFRFIFHEGNFEGIEDWSWSRSYTSSKKVRKSKLKIERRKNGAIENE